MKALQIFVLSVLFIFVADATDYRKLCRLFKINTKLRLPGSCDQYIVCNGSSGQILSCETDSKYDAKQQKCIKNLDTTKLCDNRCLNTRNGIWIANPTDCRSFYYCENEEAFLSYCGPEYYFDQDQQKCVYPRHSQCFHDVNNICELVADQTLFRDENDCSKYYKCEKGKLIKLDCRSQYFNLETGRCAQRSTVRCNVQHPTADTCLKSREPYVGEISDGATCRGYYLCDYKGKYAHDLEPVWLQCPSGTFFDQKMRKCLPARDVKCNFNRCDGRGNSRVISENNNCRNYLECKNNMIVREATCQNHYFFDDRLSACVPYIIYDKCCDDASTYPHTTYLK